MNSSAVLGIILIVHILVALNAIKMINKSVKFNASQKRINTILVWTIPFLWSFLVRNILKEPEIKIMTRNKRKKNSKGNTSSWQSLTGHGGGGTFD